MIELAYIARPLIGAVIGYITNDIAIRMLFRPRTAKYIFGMKVPFTPGLIPKEKPRIAAAIGDAISTHLMNRDVLERTLLSDEMIARIREGMRSFVGSLRHNDETVGQWLLHYLSAEEIESMSRNATSDLSAQVHSALSSAGLGPKVAAIVVDHVMEKVRSGLLGRLGADQIIGLVASPLENLLSKNISEILAHHSEEMARSIIGGQIRNVMDMPVKELLEGKDQQIEQAETTLLKLYRTLVTERLPQILDTLDISRIVEARINEMDVRESERLILQVMSRELKAIVWLGALLGFVMGCVNLMF